MKVLVKTKKLKYIPEKLYYRRYRQNSTINSPISEKKMNDKLSMIAQVQGLLLEEISKKGSGMLMYLSYYWNLFGGVLYEALTERNLQDKKHWGNIIYERYRESRRILADGQDIDENLSILGGRCLILSYLEEMGIQIDDREYQELRNRYQKRVVELLRMLPLQDEDAVAGIYGTGKHTDNLMEAYETLVGKIRCRIVYLETSPEKGRTYKNQQVYCMKDKIKELPVVIISSFLYQDKMIKNVKETGAGTEILVLYHYNEAREIKWYFVMQT